MAGVRWCESPIIWELGTCVVHTKTSGVETLNGNPAHAVPSAYTGIYDLEPRRLARHLAHNPAMPNPAHTPTPTYSIGDLTNTTPNNKGQRTTHSTEVRTI